jgi:DNA-binding transcriptional ArsR family regulator
MTGEQRTPGPGLPEPAEPGIPGAGLPEPAEPGTPEGTAEPGMPGNLVKLTDPKMMRALAHQARIAIWTYLGLHGPATATECAEIAGLSPSACSYHLRTLARYGFVEEDPASAADGRERPWRARLIAFNIEEGPGVPAATQLAGRLLAENMRAAAEEGRARYLAHSSEYPADWQLAAGETFSVAHVTPEELDRMRAEVLEVMAPYIRLDPDSRPTGALPVRVMLDLYPWFGPEETRAGEEGS